MKSYSKIRIKVGEVYMLRQTAKAFVAANNGWETWWLEAGDKIVSSHWYYDSATWHMFLDGTGREVCIGSECFDTDHMVEL